MIIGYKVDIKIIPELVSEKMKIAEHCVASVGHEEPKENPFCLIIGSIFQSSGEMAFYIWPKLRIAFDICIGKFFRGITLMPIIFNTDNTDVSIVHAKGRGSEWLTKINQDQITDYIRTCLLLSTN